MNHVCPNCGYCPCCGRKYTQPQPYIGNPIPYTPPYVPPTWPTTICIGGTVQDNHTATFEYPADWVARFGFTGNQNG